MTYKQYPKGIIRTRVGGKVVWLVYGDFKTAMEASAVATHNAIVASNEGFDFGYQTPGTVTEIEDGYEVCIP